MRSSAVWVRSWSMGRVSVANVAHAIACVDVAVKLEHAYPNYRVMGER